MRDGTRQHVLFSSVKSRRVEVLFDEPEATSDGGALLLKQVDQSLGLTASLASAMREGRCSAKVRHALLELVRQRVFGIACGYVDCNDAGRMSTDPMHGLLCEKDGELASQPTLSRFENGVSATTLFRMGLALMDAVIASQQRRHRKPRRITIDLDGTVDPTHGRQQHALFHGFYDTWCYLPLLGFISFDDEKEQHLVAALLRRGTAREQQGGLAVLKRLVAALRVAFPGAEILVRLDAGFEGSELFDLLEELDVRFVVAIASNPKLAVGSVNLLQIARRAAKRSGTTARLFGEQIYRGRKWSRAACRVICKAEVVAADEKPLKDNPRYVATDLRGMKREDVYALYAARGDVENRIKELKDDLEIDRTSCSSFSANQLRVLLTAAAYVLYQELRTRICVREEVRPRVSTLRLQLIKIGGRIVQSVRRIVLHLAASHPWRDRWSSIARHCRIPIAVVG
jgi:hypothetical protein